jgi:hypothetical protein
MSRFVSQSLQCIPTILCVRYLIIITAITVATRHSQSQLQLQCRDLSQAHPVLVLLPVPVPVPACAGSNCDKHNVKKLFRYGLNRGLLYYYRKKITHLFIFCSLVH